MVNIWCFLTCHNNIQTKFAKNANHNRSTCSSLVANIIKPCFSILIVLSTSPLCYGWTWEMCWWIILYVAHNFANFQAHFDPLSINTYLGRPKWLMTLNSKNWVVAWVPWSATNPSILNNTKLTPRCICCLVWFQTKGLLYPKQHY